MYRVHLTIEKYIDDGFKRLKEFGEVADGIEKLKAKIAKANNSIFQFIRQDLEKTIEQKKPLLVS